MRIVSLIMAAALSACSSSPKKAPVHYPLSTREPAASPSSTIERLPVMNYAEGGEAIVQTIFNGNHFRFESCVVDFKQLPTGEKLLQYLNSDQADCTPMHEGLLEMRNDEAIAELNNLINSNFNRLIQAVHLVNDAPERRELATRGMQTAVASAGIYGLALISPLAVRRPLGVLAVGTAAVAMILAYLAKSNFLLKPPPTLDASVHRARESREFKDATKYLNTEDLWMFYVLSLKEAADQVVTRSRGA